MPLEDPEYRVKTEGKQTADAENDGNRHAAIGCLPNPSSQEENEEGGENELNSHNYVCKPKVSNQSLVSSYCFVVHEM